MQKIISLLIVILAFSASGQTSGRFTNLYKRIAIIKNGNERRVNDDAHYITFTGNGLYISDKNGNGLSNHLYRHISDRGGLHCYEGELSNGDYAEYFFSPNYDRINLKNNDEIHVYTKVNGNSTDAAWRQTASGNRNNANSQQAGAQYVPVNMPIYTPVNNGSSSSQSRPTRRTCTYCHGTGQTKGRTVDAPNYTGEAQAKQWCDICGRYVYPHVHIDTMCRVCNGKGYIE